MIDVAMGRVHPHSLKPVPPAEQRQADIAFFDQNLLDGVLGSDLAEELKASGFTNVTCVLTGSSNDELEHLARQPGIDLAFAKGCPVLEMRYQLLGALDRKRRAIASN